MKQIFWSIYLCKVVLILVIVLRVAAVVAEVGALLAVPVSKELIKGQRSGDDALSGWNQQDTGTTSHMMNNKRKGSLHSLIHFCSINPQWDFTPPVTFFCSSNLLLYLLTDPEHVFDL